MITFPDVKQGTDDWFRLRAGVPTASEFHRIMTPKTMKPAAAQMGYIFELIEEIRFGPQEGFATQAMENGLTIEPEARRFYEMERQCDVQQVGFCLTDDKRFGCSPDGLIGEDGSLELKCPTYKTQLGYLWDGGVPSDYLCQVHGQLIVTGRKYVDFLSYHPDEAHLLIRVEPSEFTEKLRKELDAFWELFQKVKAKLMP